MKGLAAAGTVLAVLVGVACFLIVLPPAVPEGSRFELRLSEVRALALGSDGSLPSRLNVLVVAESRKPLIGAVGGLRWGQHVMPWTSFQIVYDDSFLVVDAAADAAFHRERDAKGTFHAERFLACQAALRSASAILFTHEHPDHVGGVVRSPHLAELLPRVRLTREQLAHAASFDPAGFPPEVRQLRPLDYEGRFRIAPGVVLIEARGHTPGSQIVYVRLRTGHEYLLVGDIVWHRAHFEEPRGHPRISAWLLGEDLPAVLAQLRAIHEAWREEGIIVVPSHDGPYLAELIASGALGSAFE